MKWIEVKVTFASVDNDLAVDLIADVFYSLNTKGVVVDDPAMEPEESWAPDAVSRPDRPAVTGYLPADDRWETHRQAFETAISRLAYDHAIAHTIDYKPIDEEDWAESWKAYFKPQKITPRLVVKPTWREYEPEPGQQVIEIDPGMAFGTGTHPTTELCIQLLEKHVSQGDRVLDVGTGSGILLIAAAKLGAARLMGIDLDPGAVDIARRNLEVNGIGPSVANLKAGNLVEDITGVYDVVVANILAEVILELMDDAFTVVKPGGIFICSGIIQAFQTGVAEKMASSGFDILEKKTKEDWVAFVGQRR